MVYQYLISLIINVMLSIVIIFPVYDSLCDPAFFLLRKQGSGVTWGIKQHLLEGSIWIHIGNILVLIIPELIINQPYHDLSVIY